MPRPACPTAPSGSVRPCRSAAPAPPRRSPRPSCGCCRMPHATASLPCSASMAAAEAAPQPPSEGPSGRYRARVAAGELKGDADQEAAVARLDDLRSEEHTSELQSLMRISYAVFCLKKKKKKH